MESPAKTVMETAPRKRNIPLGTIAFVGRYLPRSGYGGSDTHLLDFLHYLKAAGFSIHFYLFAPPPGGKGWCVAGRELSKLASISGINQLRIGRLLIERSRINNLFSLRWWLRKLLRHLPAPGNAFLSACKARVGRFLDRLAPQVSTPEISLGTREQQLLPAEHELRAFRRWFRRMKPDVLIADFAWLCPIFDAVHAPHLVRAVFTHDLLHQRYTDFTTAGVESGAPAWNREQEAWYLRKADILIAVQEEDAAILRDMIPEKTVVCVPMAASSSFIPIEQQIAGRCLFVGSNADQNVQGLRWLLEEVWPRVLSELPDNTLHVCGNIHESFAGESYRNVNFLGLVDDLVPEYGRAEVCLIPLLVGSGLKIKLVEALSHGRVCVSTSIGLQGMRELADKAVLVANEPAEFAGAIIKLLASQQLRHEMEMFANQYINARLSPNTAYQPFVNLIMVNIHEVD
ncbi:MAG: glycosyltransferase [Armatimonadota bacterium]